MSFIKGVTEAYKEYGFSNINLYGYCIVALCVGIFQLTMINMSMELYDQVETIPIYQSSLILLQIAAGAVILQEIRLYTPLQFLIVVFFGLIAILGVFIIVKKPLIFQSTDNQNTSDHLEQQLRNSIQQINKQCKKC